MRPEHWLYTIPLRLRSLFRRREADQELDEELRDHVERRTEEYVANGLSLKEARRRALLEIGGIERRKEECREMRRVSWIQDLMQDLHFGLRMLRKSPGFTAVAVLILALGIGANTAIFGIVDAVLLRPLPVPHSEQLVDVYSGLPLQLLFIRDFPLSHPEYQDLARQNTSFSGLLAYHADLFALERESSSRLVPGMLVTGNYFNVLGVKAVLGRTFDAAEVAKPRGYSVAVISHSLWQEQFAGNPNVLGKTIDLNGQLFTVIGVAPPSFNGLVIAPTPQVWIPLTRESYQAIDHVKLEDRGESDFWVVGRLKSDQTIRQAQAEISTIATRLAAQYPETEKDHTFRLYPANQVRILPEIDKMLYGASAVLMGVVGLVLLIACINMAAMSLARAASRRKEIAVRLSLGASRRRLIRAAPHGKLIARGRWRRDSPRDHNADEWRDRARAERAVAGF